jgi:hypothetical protein
MTVGSSGKWQMTNTLAEDRGGNAVRRPLQQLSGKATVDAVAEVKEFAERGWLSA